MNKLVIAEQSLGGVLALWVAAAVPDLPGAIVSVDGLSCLDALPAAVRKHRVVIGV